MDLKKKVNVFIKNYGSRCTTASSQHAGTSASAMSVADLKAAIAEILHKDDGPCDFKMTIKRQHDSSWHGTPLICIQPCILAGSLKYVLRDTSAFKGPHVEITFGQDELKDIATYLFDNMGDRDTSFDLYVVQTAKEGIFKDNPEQTFGSFYYDRKKRDIDALVTKIRMCGQMKNIPRVLPDS